MLHPEPPTPLPKPPPTPPFGSLERPLPSAPCPAAPRPTAADFLVSCCLEAYHAARAARAKLVGWRQLLQRALLRCSMHAARSGLVLAAVAAGEWGAGPRLPASPCTA